MRLLLDTHVFLWWVTADPRLSRQARATIADGRNVVYLSAASGWEMAIKAGLGRLRVADDLERFVPEQMARNGIEALPVALAHALRVQSLPTHHPDPFDRLLVAQAQLEGTTRPPRNGRRPLARGGAFVVPGGLRRKRHTPTMPTSPQQPEDEHCCWCPLYCAIMRLSMGRTKAETT